MRNVAAPAGPGQKPDPEATASYVAEMAGEMAYLARAEGLETLGFILEMAKLEAENCVRGVKPRP